jgi:two-component system, NarL family, response regulator NreC
MPRTRLLIADDHALVRAGLRSLLEGQPDLEVVGEADDGVTAVGKCKSLAPEIVLMDLAMPGCGGVEAIQDLGRTCPGVKVLVVTMHEDETYARQAWLAGAAGYVSKKSVAASLLAAIRAVRRGQRCFPPSLADARAQPARAVAGTGPRGDVLAMLTSREREVVREIALGHTNAEVAGRLHISEKTVETHRKNILAKLGLRSRADLVRFALEYKLLRA